MKKYLFFSLLITILFFSCNNNSSTKVDDKISDLELNAPDTSKEVPSFFPVTSYILGQVEEIKKTYKTIRYYHTKNGITDSTNLQPAGFALYLDELRYPAIDSISMCKYFKEQKFNDETLGLTTLTYDATGPVPDSIAWKRWDVYIEPETGYVKRIYMVKRVAADRIAQLTWLSAEQFKMVFINDEDAEHPKVLEEMLFKWVY